MTKTFFADRATAVMSPRTAKYVAAMVREGDTFDYDKWLKRVREQEAQAKQTEATGASGELVTPDDWNARQIPALRLVTQTIRISGALRRRHHQARSKTPKARLRRWLEEVSRAWREFQASRARDGVYGYLETVFAIVAHFRGRRRTKRLLRHAFEFADLPLDARANVFAAVIRCTSDRDIDSKTVSKWSRALRYVARSKAPDMRLKMFMKEAGGVNACADRYARLMRHR